MAVVKRLTEQELVKLYDDVFEEKAEDPHSPAGKAHMAALEKVYEKGIEFGEFRATSRS